MELVSPLLFEDRLVLALLALAANAVAAGPYWFWRSFGLPSPASWLDGLVRYLEAKLNREQRSAKARRFRGLMLTCVLIAIVWQVGKWLEAASHSSTGGYVIVLGLLMLLIPLRQVMETGRELGKAIEKNNLEEARALARQFARRNIGQLDAHALCRAGIEGLAEQFSFKICAGLIWYLLLGMPGLLTLCLVRRLRALIGHVSPIHAFGWAAAKVDVFMNFVPARIAGLLLALVAALVPKGDMPGAFATLFRAAPNFKSPNRGWPLAAAAGALRLSLGGPYSWQLVFVEDPWAENGTAKATLLDLRRAFYLYLVACLVLTLLAGMLAYFTLGPR